MAVNFSRHRIGHPLGWASVWGSAWAIVWASVWASVCLSVAVAIGVWGALFPEVRSSQITINLFVRDSGNEYLDSVARAIDVLFSPTSATILTLALAVAWGVLRKSLRTGVGFALAVVLTWLPIEILKIIFHQSRPVGIQILEGIGVVNPQSSFPSGHVGFAIALSFAVLLIVPAGRARGFLVAALTALIVLVAVTRVYAGVHYVSDTVGSVGAAAVGMLLFIQVWPRMWPLKSHEQSAHSLPSEKTS